MGRAQRDERGRPLGCGPPGAESWKGLCGPARLYLAAGAWRSAHDLLEAPLRDLDGVSPLPLEAVEALCLFLAACTRLGHDDHVASGCARLRSVESSADRLPAEASVLLAHALAQEETRAGRYAQAQARLEALADDRLAATGACTRARLALLEGRIAAALADERRAERAGLSAAELAAEAGSETLRGDAYSLLAIVARRRGALAEANSLYARASHLYWQSGNLSGHTVVLLNRAWAVGLIGLLPQSRALFEEAGQHAHALGRATTELLARLGLGWVAVRGGELAEARARLLGAWREARRRRLPREEALALAYLAEAHLLAGRPGRAERALRLATRLAERLAPEGDLALEVRIRHSLLALARGDLDACRAEARRALVLARRAGMHWEEAQALRLEGVALARRGHRREARRVLQRAQILLEAMGEQLERRVVQAWLVALRPLGGAAPAPAAQQVWLGSDAALRFWLRHPLLGPPVEGGAAEARAARTAPRGAGARSGARDAGSDAGARSGAGDAEPGADARPQIWSEVGLVTRSPELLATLRQIEVYATSDLPILILGETGTGKDLVAQGIHALSGLAGRHVPVNCAATRKDLFVAELFGARRGAYTGADRDRSGLIEEARGGTLFLDEVADLEPEAQGFLLRFLDSGEIRALGDAQTRRVKARVVAATCVDLAERVAAGRFRPDLYGRLAGLVVQLPPLRERQEDLDPIASALWRREGGDPAKYPQVFTPGVLALLAAWHWPGNARELRHTVGRALLYTRTHGTDAARVSIEDWGARLSLPPERRGALAVSVRPAPDGQAPPARPAWDDELLRRTLAEAGGRVSLAARRLGISRSHAYRLYRRLGIPGAA